MDSTLSAASFFGTSGMCIDSSNKIYVVETGNYVVRQITSTNVYTLAGNGVSGNKDGAQTWAQFNSPSGVAIISSGIWIVSDSVYLRLISISKYFVCYYCEMT